MLRELESSLADLLHPHLAFVFPQIGFQRKHFRSAWCGGARGAFKAPLVSIYAEHAEAISFTGKTYNAATGLYEVRLLERLLVGFDFYGLFTDAAQATRDFFACDGAGDLDLGYEGIAVAPQSLSTSVNAEYEERAYTQLKFNREYIRAAQSPGELGEFGVNFVYEE